MRKRARRVAFLVFLAAFTASNVPDLLGAAAHMKNEAVSEEQLNAPEKFKGDKSEALIWLEVGTRRLKSREYEQARAAFEKACAIMYDFKCDGEYRALATLGGKEETKQYRGDPYEKTFAFLYLGILDLMAGKYEDALASLKTAEIADAGTRLEGYKSDCTMVYSLQALCHKLLNEPEAMRECLAMARKTEAFKKEMDLAIKCAVVSCNQLKNTVTGSERDKKAAFLKIDCVFELFMDFLPGCVERERDAAAGTVKAAQMASGLLDNANDKSSQKNEDAVLRRRTEELLKVVKLDEARRTLTFLGETGRENVSLYKSYLAKNNNPDRESLFASMEQPETNTLVIVHHGRGPYKYRVGQKDEKIKFGALAGEPVVYSLCFQPAAGCEGAQVETTVIPVESAFYQATTRGGRVIDYLLKDKVAFEYQTATVSEILNQIAQFAGIAASGASFIFTCISMSTHAEADMRCWRNLPEQVAMNLAYFPAGNYQFKLVDGNKSCAMEMPWEIKKEGLNVVFLLP